MWQNIKIYRKHFLTVTKCSNAYCGEKAFSFECSIYLISFWWAGPGSIYFIDSHLQKMLKCQSSWFLKDIEAGMSLKLLFGDNLQLSHDTSHKASTIPSSHSERGDQSQNKFYLTMNFFFTANKSFVKNI